ncbi:hypothetical protein Goklo_017294 [Gossypium klotzschianum]|uniref:Uncharacterized protein n=1 Tax=Gossypium klotzschianum TaxID=34286 RepID=A0A7J8UH08_9ROSI|nr:hypothetical protein [Gossypium klotzschianum]
MLHVVSSNDGNSSLNRPEKGCYREKKSENLNQKEWEKLDKKALSAIQLYLANTILQKVLMEKTSLLK